MGPELFGVGALEALLVMVIALIVVGPQRLPEIARQSGRWYRVARRYTAEITADVRGALSEIEDEVKAETEDLRSVREIGGDLESGLKETESDLDRIGREAQPADTNVDIPPALRPPGHDGAGAPGSAASRDGSPTDGTAGQAPDDAAARPGGADS